MPNPDAVVPYLDLGAAYRELSTEFDACYKRVMESGWYLLDSELSEFETEFAKYSGSTHCVGVANGLDAISLALRAVGVRPGDEVIVPSNTYVATWLAVTAVGAIPVPVEPNLGTHNIDAAGISHRITSRTRAVIPVHLYGEPAEMGPILDLAKGSGLKVVADAAQAHGATSRGKPIGGLGDVACWSFYPSKNLGAFGDGGAITTNSDEYADVVRVLGNYGSRQKYVNEIQGVNSRLDSLQAAFLRVKLRHLDEWNARRASVAARYLDAFSELENLTIPQANPNAKSAWHLFVVRHPNRDEFQNELAQMGVQSFIHYPIPPHRQEAYAELGSQMDLPIAESLAGQVLSLPIGPHLDDDMVEQVIAAVKNATQRI